jgi:predicted phosphodiesterase
MRILILSDIHSNLEALEAAIASTPTFDVAVNLGDIVGYGASPNEVIARSRQVGTHFVRGNHDKAACGLMEITDFNPVAGMAALWTRETLTPENLEWLRQLPQGPVRLDESLDAQFVHGSPIDEDEYVVTLRDALDPLTYSSVMLTFFGHTHLQGAFWRIGKESFDAVQPAYASTNTHETFEVPLKREVQYLINPGSVGQPRDGDWRAAFAWFDSEDYKLVFHRAPYDLERAQQRILQANLPPRLASRLAIGR